MEKTTKKNKSVRAVPEGFHTVTPYFIVDEAQEFIDFLKEAFNAKETFVHKREEDGGIMHATVKIGDSTIMLGETMEGMKANTTMLYLYVDDVDKLYKQAIAAGAIKEREVKDEFYGDRCGCVKDDWGNSWWISTHVEDVDDKELKKRSREMEDQRKEAHV